MNKYYLSSVIFLFCCNTLSAQQINKSQPNQATPENIYTIKQQFLQKELHNPTDKNEGGADNDLARFNRWFNFVEPRCYPSGNLPRPDVLLTEYDKVRQSFKKGAKTTSTPAWSPLGPFNVPTNFFGIGRINCIVIDPLDTNTLYVGAACGGLWISHNGGATWTSHTDNFPSLSIADIAVNPHHHDTLYAATGDGYGYEYPNDATIFWGGLYTAGVMKSTDGGSTWHTTGLSYLESNRDNIQRLLIHPNNPNILLAATRHGIYRTSDAGVTWSVVDTSHVYTMAFHPQQPNTIYAVNNADVLVSYNAGLTWSSLYAGVSSGGRCTIAVSPASPNSIWILDDANDILLSHDEGASFNTISSVTMTYDNYGRVLAVSPTDSTYVITSGLQMNISYDGGYSWNPWDSSMYYVHSDHHAAAFNPLNPQTFYDGNDGGIVVTHDGGISWTNISNGLAISQIYRMSSSRLHPYIMLAGLQDNATFYNNGTTWLASNGPFGDGMDCAISPVDENIQIASTQYGNFSISIDGGATFNQISPSSYPSNTGAWTSPVLFNPNNYDTIYFGFQDVFASYDGGSTLVNLTTTAPFNSSLVGSNGCVSLAICYSNTQVLYAANYTSILRTTDGGSTWTDVTGTLPVSSVGITHIAIDYNNPMLVYVSTSGYLAGNKVFKSTTGGTTWTNISGTLPNIPANCIATDRSTTGALFLGTDVGMYYTDASLSSWIPYGTGLPNVIVDDIDINYTNSKVRAATYGRGIWECDLLHPLVSLQVNTLTQKVPEIYPNPASDAWHVIFQDPKPATYSVTVSDISGRVLHTQANNDIIDASLFASGAYNIEVNTGDKNYCLKAIKK